MEAVGENHAVAGEDHRRVGDGEAVGIEQRQRIEEPLLFRNDFQRAAGAEVALGGEEEIFVGDDAALGHAGGARRVHEHAFRLTAGRRAAGCACCARQRRAEVRLIDDGDGAAERRHAGLDVGDVLGERDDEIDLGMAEDVGQVVGAELGVERHRPAAQRIEREEVQHESRAVLEHDGDAVAVPIAGGSVGVGEARDALGHLAIAPQHAVGVVGAGGTRRHAEAREIRLALCRVLQRLPERVGIPDGGHAIDPDLSGAGLNITRPSSAWSNTASTGMPT